MQVENVKLSELVHYVSNPRKNDHAVNKVAAAIREFGFRVPILCRKDKTIIDGHLRAKAAVKLNLDDVPVVYIDDMTDAQIKAFRISINRMAELADWDEELLAAELQALREMDYDLNLTGFDLSEIDKFLDEESGGLTDNDAVPETPITPISKKGDIWICGPHKIMCGDWLNEEHRASLMNGECAHLIFTDPPYNADYSSRVDKGRRKEWGGIKNDNMSYDEYNCFIQDVFACAPNHIIPNASLYACIDWKSSLF